MATEINGTGKLCNTYAHSLEVLTTGANQPSLLYAKALSGADINIAGGYLGSFIVFNGNMSYDDNSMGKSYYVPSDGLHRCSIKSGTWNKASQKAIMQFTVDNTSGSSDIIFDKCAQLCKTASGDSNTDNTKNAMLYVSILDTPQTVPAGEVKSFVLTTDWSNIIYSEPTA